MLRPEDVIRLLQQEAVHRAEREPVLTQGYPGYDTSIGWFHYSDEQVRENARRAVDAGFSAMKLKVGSPDTARDIHRALMVREVVGPDVQIMLDANQQWTLPVALRTCLELTAMQATWYVTVLCASRTARTVASVNSAS